MHNPTNYLDKFKRKYIDGFVKYIVGYVMNHFGSFQCEIKAKGDFMAMGGSFEKKRMKMNALMADQNAQNALTHLKEAIQWTLVCHEKLQQPENLNYLPGNVDLGTACGKYYRVSYLSIIDPAAMENTVLEENTATMFNINEALKVVLSLLLQIPALQNPFSFKRRGVIDHPSVIVALNF
uniref:Uncharacterized protein n=1 Tax=Cucumis melo TaxID=3656 RepID=A0A9I9EGE2_CUCME